MSTADESTPPDLRDLLLNAAATLCVAASATMLTDFSRRLLGSDLDSLGVASVAVQAFFVLAASSTFTDGGWATICSLIQRYTHHPPNQTLWRFGLSLLLLAITIPAWTRGPHELAKYYGWAGFRALSPTTPGVASNPDLALKDFQRALALDPSLANTSTDIGGAFEAFYRYDDAVKAYQTGIALNPNELVAYNNLARIMLLEGHANLSLRITQQALSLKPSPDDPPDTISILHKTQAAAELQLGLYNQAITDASQANSAAGDCVLAQAYDRLGQQTSAQQAWNSFLHRPPPSTGYTPALDPECTLRAKEFDEKH